LWVIEILKERFEIVDGKEIFKVFYYTAMAFSVSL
jgi:hypothetical protein